MQVKQIRNKAKWAINKNSFLNYCEEVVQDEPTTMLTTLTAWPSSTLMPTVKSTTRTVFKRPELSSSTQTKVLTCDNEELKTFLKMCVNKCLTDEDVAACVGRCSSDDAVRKTQCKTLCDCDKNANCSLQNGIAECSCGTGYNGDGKTCFDLDECEIGLHSCDLNAHCYNNPGSYKCECKRGYEGDGVQICAVSDECLLGEHRCHKNAVCTDLDDQYKCDCSSGFKGDGFSCSDIDECSTRNHDCDVNAVCSNRDGSFTCLCQSGYRGDGRQCEEIDECAENIHHCGENADCVNTAGSFNCVCIEGHYEVDNKCVKDVNECTTGDHTCGKHAGCVNTMGSYSCNCNAGYIDVRGICKKVDSCVNEVMNGNDPCGQHASCNQTKNGFACQCESGYQMNNYNVCVDIDECREQSDKCDENATCFNFQGSYSCSCHDGYIGNGYSCNCNTGYTDIRGICKKVDNCVNEIMNGNDPCGQHASCKQTKNGFACQCESGYQMNKSNVCVDIDECRERIDKCDENASCNNLQGSYSCACRDGYNGNGFNCADLDECSCMNVCDEKATCANTAGSYTCTCHDGYHGDGHKCRKGHVLAINTFEGNKQAVVIDPAGDYTTVDFQFGAETEVYLSCSMQWKNQMVVFGGLNEKRQISEVTMCGLNRIGTLSFDLRTGACANMKHQTIVLCFDWENAEGKLCRAGDGPLGAFTKIVESHFHHYSTRTTANNDKILAVGSRSKGGEVRHNHVEYYSTEATKWTIGSDYPYHTTIFAFEMVQHEDGFIVFGGLYKYYTTAVIAKYDPVPNAWSKLGNLNKDRHGFGLIQLEDEYLIVGGQDDKKSEICRLENDAMICLEREPTMTYFFYYPELFIIDPSFADQC